MHKQLYSKFLKLKVKNCYAKVVLIFISYFLLLVGNTNNYKWKRWFRVKHFVLLHHQSMSTDMLNLNQYYKQLLLTTISTAMFIVDLEWREKNTVHWHLHMAPLKTVELWGYFTLHSTGIGWLVGVGWLIVILTTITYR